MKNYTRRPDPPGAQFGGYHHIVSFTQDRAWQLFRLRIPHALCGKSMAGAERSLTLCPACAAIDGLTEVEIAAIEAGLLAELITEQPPGLRAELAAVVLAEIAQRR